MRRLGPLLAALLMVWAPSALAQRRLIAPSSLAPARVAPGGTLSLLVEVATGLTPPPGVQEDRAHRLFAASLCADGLDLGAGARRCFPLSVRNVRPVDGASLRYRVEMPVPLWVAPWRYDLLARFPGGQVTVLGAVEIARNDRDRPGPGTPSATPHGGGYLLQGASAELVRVHAGVDGLKLDGGRFEAFPLPDSARGLAAGFVALVRGDPDRRVFVTKRHASQGFALAIGSGEARAGRPVQLRAEGAPRDASLFWWLDAERGARGSDVTTTFSQRGAARVELLAVTADGRSARAQTTLPIWQRRAFGCALQPASKSAGPVRDCVTLLLIMGLWRRGCRREGRRPSAC